MTRPRVLQICVLAGSGGVEHHVLALARNLGAVADVVVVACSGSWLEREVRAAGLAVRTVPEPNGNFDVSTLATLRAVIREQKPDIVHSHLGRSDWYTWLALAGMPTLKLVSTEHGISADRQDLYVTGIRRRLHEFAHSLRFRRTNALIAVSASTAETLAARYRVLKGRNLPVIAPGLDDRRLFKVHRQLRAFGAPLRIVVVARLAREKGVDTAITSFAGLRSAGVAATLTIVGSGPESAALEDLSRSLGASDVHFAGHVDDVLAHLVAADVFLMPSRSENLPIALLEGMAAGLPAVATNVGGIPEVLRDGVDGILVPVEDDAAVTSALSQLAADPERCHKMGISAREAAREHDIEHTVQAIGRVYESLR